MPKPELVHQEVNIQDIISELVADCENGELMTASGRSFANIEGGNGRLYSFAIIATCDDGDFCYNWKQAVVDPDLVRNGKGIVKAPKDRFSSSKIVDEETLDFADPDDY